MDFMERPRFNLATFLLLSAAIPIWVFLAVAVPVSTGWGGNPFRFVAAPLVLCGMTVAIQRLLRDRANSWPISVLAAGFIAIASLSIAAWLSS